MITQDLWFDVVYNHDTKKWTVLWSRNHNVYCESKDLMYAMRKVKKYIESNHLGGNYGKEYD